MIPFSCFVTMGVVNKVENFICDLAQHRDRPTKSWNHVRVSTGIGEPTKQHTQSFNTIAYRLLITRERVWNLWASLSFGLSLFLTLNSEIHSESAISSRSNLPYSSYGKSSFFERFSLYKRTNSSSERTQFIYQSTKSSPISLRELIL